MKSNVIEKKKSSLLEPAIEELAEQVGNKYILCNVVSKRAKEIIKLEQENEEKIDSNEKEITKASIELKNGDITIEKIEENIEVE